ncbi:MAG TPA: hypothetical protein VI959_03775, partial [Alphaproteobacteria bacterium]|nr:hypothetical protein [Alphaproteobacteria bacterium]
MKALRILAVFFSISFSSFGSLSDDFLELVFHNVGSGNCTVVRTSHGIFMFDCGSSSINRESQEILTYEVQENGVKSNLEIKKNIFNRVNVTPSKKNNNKNFATKRKQESITEECFKKKIDQSFLDKKKIILGELDSKRDSKENLFNSITKNSFPKHDEDDQKLFQAVTISHPDKDHVNYLISYFTDDITINSLILGGSFQTYFEPEKSKGRNKKKQKSSKKAKTEDTEEEESKTTTFSSWLKNRLSSGMRVHIPAITKVILTKDNVNQFFENFEDGQIKLKNNDKIAELGVHDKDYDDLTLQTSAIFSDAFKSEDSNFHVHCLSSNADSGFKDPNSSSLVVCLTYCGNRVLIPGDATNKTFEKIFKNYAQELEKDSNYLKMKIVMVPHHGTIKECNNAQFYKTFNPRYAVISSGFLINNGHPRKEALENIFWSNDLKQEEQEHIIVSAQKKQKKAKKDFYCAFTKEAIYCTVCCVDGVKFTLPYFDTVEDDDNAKVEEPRALETDPAKDNVSS